MTKLNPLAAAIAIIAAPCAPAQTTDNNTAQDSLQEEVVVVGHIIRGEMAATEAQRNADRIINVINADGIGKLPDRNAAEAVQRIPGVSIERDMGEGRFVAVRGLPSQWSSSTVNGNRLPTAEQETSHRGTAFDFLPSEMIERVEVSKAITPDMDGDAIGGNVNFVTRTAPDEFTLAVNVAGGAHERAEGSDYSTNITYGDRSTDGKFGYIMSATAWNREWATDNFEPRRGGDGIGIRRLELRDYVGTRDTYGLNLGTEYLLEDGRVYATALYGTLQDDETHYKHRLRFDKDRIEVQHIYNEMITEMQGFEFGGEHALSPVTEVEWKIGHYDNEFRYDNHPNAEDNAYFVARFDQTNVGFVGLEDRGAGNLAYNVIDGGTDVWNAVSNHLPQDFQMDPSQMEIANIQLYKGYINEKDNIVLNADLSHELNSSLTLKFGAKYRDKERISTYSDEYYTWDEANGPTPVLGDFALSDQPGRSDFLDQLDVGFQEQFTQVASVEDMKNFWNSNRDNFTLDEDASALIQNGGAGGRHFNVFEQHTSAYGMAEYNPNDHWTIVGGLRLTQTDTEVEGWAYEVDADGVGSAEQVTQDKSYLSVLPSVHVTYAHNDDLNVRMALSRTFARPDFGYLTPGSLYREADFELTSGNPEVDPTYSNNLDLMAEYYFERLGLVSAGFFYKDIVDPIFQSVEIGDYKGMTGVTKIRPDNGDNASLMGLELAFNRSLDFISPALENFGVQTNATFMDSEMKIPGRDDTVTIPRQADTLYNFGIFYDDSIFAARLAVNHKGAYIEEHGGSPDSDTYYGEYTSLDMTASYSVNDNAMIYLELNNLTDEPLYYYLGSDQRPLQYEFYGAKGMLGFNYNF